MTTKHTLIQDHVKEHIAQLKNFNFHNGQTLETLNLNYFTLGEPKFDSQQNIANAILLLHNTTGSAKEWLGQELGGELFLDGQIFDFKKYYLIMPDAIGFGRSSKPSDGLARKFPNYRYIDIVNAHHLLMTEILKISHLHLTLGLSMGGMLAWMLAGMYPDFCNFVVPIACQPGPISGRNWIQRRISMEAIKNDPDWNGGNYIQKPSRYVYTAPFGGLMVQSVVRLQELAPTREAADALYEKMVERARQGDANDRLYQLEASSDYDPTSLIPKIKARLLAINFEDDELNPPQLKTVENVVKHIPQARHVLINASSHTAGHYSSLKANLWKKELIDFLIPLGF
jgi:homoserine O-acetyltransferase